MNKETNTKDIVFEQTVPFHIESASLLLDTLSEAALILDCKGQVVAINDIAAERIHKKPQEIIGLNIFDFFSEPVRTYRTNSFLEVVRTGRATTFVDKRDNSWVRQKLSPIKDKDGKILYVIVHAEDISEEKYNQDKLRLAYDILCASQQAKSLNDFLRQVITKIQSYCQCEAVGIRLLDSEGNIPYQAYNGFPDSFYIKESPLSIKSDHCMCIHVIRGETNPDLPVFTEKGSFYINGTSRFLATVDEQTKGVTRNVCNEYGYESVSLIPIKNNNDILGLIHLADSHEDTFPLCIVEVVESISQHLSLSILQLQAEQREKQQKQLLNNVITNLPCAVFEYQMSPEGSFSLPFISDQGTELLERSLTVLKDPSRMFENICPEHQEQFRKSILESARDLKQWQQDFRLVTKTGEEKWIQGRSSPRQLPDGTIHWSGLFYDITDTIKAQRASKQIEWLITKTCEPGDFQFSVRPYGNLSDLNTSGLLKNTLGRNNLREITEDFIHLLGTSAALFEKDGQYVFGVLSSGWCSYLDKHSRILCNTENNLEALSSGKWLCHESCWSKASKVCIEKGEPVDIECDGGLRLYAVPIFAGKSVVGSMNFGYGDPPKTPEVIEKIAQKYKADASVLKQLSDAYESRPLFVIETARQRLHTAARLIGEIVHRQLIQDKLCKSEERFRTLTSMAPVGVYMTNVNGQCEYVNNRWMEMSGLTLEESLGYGWIKGIHPEDRDEVLSAWNHMVQSEGHWGKEYRFLDRNGNATWVYGLARPLRDIHGKVYAYIGTNTDFTDRKQAEEKIGFHSLLLDQIYDHITATDMDGIITYVNQAECKLLEQSKEELIGKSVLSYGDDSAAGATQNEIIQTTRSKGSWRGRVVNLSKSGNRRLLDCRTRVVYNNAGAAVGMVGISTDITRQNQIEMQLRESEERYRALVEKAPCSVLILKNGKYIYANPSGLNLLGYTNEREFIGSDALNSICPQYRDLIRERIQKASNGEANEPVHFEIIRPDGQTVWVESTSVPINIAGESATLIIGNDISGKKRDQQRLLDYQQNLKTLIYQITIVEDRERKRIAAYLHDQITQSLVFVKMKLDKFKESKATGEDQVLFTELSGHLGKTLKDIRNATYDLYYPFVNEFGPVKALKEWITDEYETHYSIKVELQEIPAVINTITHELNMFIYRSCRELLTNVAKHANASKAIVTITSTPKTLEILVADDGKGDDLLDARLAEGIRKGFGLFSIKEKLQSLGGKLKIYSKTGEGTRITMTIPLEGMAND